MNVPRSCVGLPITSISFGSLDKHPVSIARISWLKFRTAISLLASAQDSRLFDSLNFLYGLCNITLSVLVTAVRHTWIPSYLPNFTLPTRIRFKLNENDGFIENDMSICYCWSRLSKSKICIFVVLVKSNEDFVWQSFGTSAMVTRYQFD